MPFNKTCSIAAMEENIASEIRAGKPREQAVAVANRTLREACRDADKLVPVRKALDVIRKQATTAVQTVILPKKKFKTRDAAVAYADEHDLDTASVRETDNAFRIQQNPAKAFTAGTFKTITIDEKQGVEAIIGRVKKAKHRERTREFLESAFQRARKVLNPRDFAVIFQAARASAGGQISAKRRRERTQYSATEKAAIDGTPLVDMSVAELKSMINTLNNAHERNEKSGHSNTKVIRRARNLFAEMRRRSVTPEGRVYVALEQTKTNKAVDAHGCDPETERYVAGRGCVKKTAAEMKKGFVNGDPEGGMHAHGLDRRNEKTLDDGGHLHIWQIPGTGEVVLSNEDGFHQHVITVGGEVTPLDGAHSHRVMMPNGTFIETKLGGEHTHALMVETSGFDGPHTHSLVMPDGSEILSMTVGQFVATLDQPPLSGPLPSASLITRAMNELRAERDAAIIGGPLPPPLPDLPEAVELTAKGVAIAPPTFTIESDKGDMLEMRHDGEIVGMSKHVVADDPEDIAKVCGHWDLIEKHTMAVPFVGPEDARLMFVTGAPTELELARKQALIGDNAITFEELYLQPLGLTKRDVAVGFAMPVLPLDGQVNPALCEKWGHHLVAAMKSYPRAKVVALGNVARDVLKSAGVVAFYLPHPSPVRRHGNSGEVDRKLKTIAKALDVTPSQVTHSNRPQGSTPIKGAALANLADVISESWKTGRVTCRVIKAAEEKQIVYGVVLDPYDVDLQTEWVPPAAIESTAHGFLKKSRVIGFEHIERAEAQIVESWVEPYPSKADYQAAMENRPHKVYTRKFGDDEIHSGTWMAGVQVGDREWEMHNQGRLNAFSVGGFSFKTKVAISAMPEVEFIQLIEAPA